MKKLVYLFALLALCGCSNLQEIVDETFKENKIEEPKMVPVQVENSKLGQEQIELNNDSIKDILSNVKNRIRSAKVREVSLSPSNSYEVYVGETLILPLKSNENSFNVVSYPKGIKYDISIVANRLKFRSLYQGDYTILLYSNGIYKNEVKIFNKLAYDFSEKNIYDVVVNSYNAKNLKSLDDTVTLYRIAFPNNSKNKELSFMLIELATNDLNEKVMGEQLSYIDKNIGLSDNEKVNLLNYISMFKGVNIVAPKQLLNYDNQPDDFNIKMADFLTNKTNLQINEISFLEKVYNGNSNDDLKNKIAKIIGDWYVKNGNYLKGKRYLESVKEIVSTDSTLMMKEDSNYDNYKSLIGEGLKAFRNDDYQLAIVKFEKANAINQNYADNNDVINHIGKSYFALGNYNKALESYKKLINLEKDNAKKAEIYYNIGMTYDKMGDKEQAKNYFTYVKQHFNNTPWSIKSSLYLMGR